MLLKQAIAVATTLTVIGIGVVSYAAEINEDKTCSVCKYEIISEPLQNTPSGIHDPLLKYVKPTSNYVAFKTSLIQQELRKVMLKLEKEGIDSRSLFGGKPFKIYSTDAYFDGYAAFTLWYGVNDDRNGIAFGGHEADRTSNFYKQNVAHEFAHMLYYYYFDPAFDQRYRQARGIPESSGNTWDTDWEKRPAEIFAEDFAQLFGNEQSFSHRGYSGKLSPDKAAEIKKLIVEAILKKQIAGKDTENQEFLKTLKKAGVIPYDDFLLCELPDYSSEEITNKQFIDWIYKLISNKQEKVSFAGIYKLSKVYEKVQVWYNEKPANAESVVEILNVFSDYISISNYKYWGIEDFDKGSGKTITRDEAARIIVNHIISVKNN